MSAKELYHRALDATLLSADRLTHLDSDTINLKEAKDVQYLLSEANEAWTAFMEQVKGNPPPKTGD